MSLQPRERRCFTAATAFSTTCAHDTQRQQQTITRAAHAHEHHNKILPSMLLAVP
jgi:hypothetical protein